MLYFGDLLVKQGNVKLARIAYNNVKLVRQYPSWPYQYMLEERLTSDLEVRAAFYRDADPKNDPPMAGNSHQRNCAYCHAATADE